MSQENVEIVCRIYESVRSGEDMSSAFDPQIQWDISAHPLPDFPNKGQGREDFVGHVAGYLGGWLDYATSTTELIEHGDNVVAIVHETARLRGSGVMLDRDLPQVWTFAGGKAVLYRVFKTKSQALEAAGLRE